MAKKGKLLFVSILVLLVLLGIDIYRRETARKEMIQGYQQQELENQEKMTFKVSDSAINTQAGEQIDSFSVLSGASTGDVLVSSEEFSERAVAQYTRSTRSSTLRYEIADDTLESDIVVLQFEAYTQHDEVDITVNFAGIETELTITSTPHAYYIPVCGAAEISELSFRQDHQAVNDDQVTIGAVYVVDYGTKYPISQLKTGTYELSGGGYDRVEFSAADSLTDGPVSQSLAHNGRFYSIYKGQLKIYEIRADGLSEISSLGGVGETRDMTFTSDYSAIVVTSRNSGAYIVDISDERAPYISAQIDTLELCTGVDAMGNYAFICSRYFGVEIVDITDISAPKFITKVQSTKESEYQDCFVDDGYLYVGVYANKRIDIYDIHNVNNITLLSEIALDGAGQGCYVKDGLLYAATGYADTSAGATQIATKYLTGTGHGLEIFDVSDPQAPVRLSAVKFDGRMSAKDSDIWDVIVSDGYAYVSGMYNGLYVYDVHDPVQPVRKAVVNAVAGNNSEYFKEYDLNKTLFPYDASAETHGCAVHTVLTDGVAYIDMSNMGVFAYKAEYIKEPVSVSSDDILQGTFIEREPPLVDGYVVSTYKPQTSVYAVASLENGYYAVACGTGGIQIIDESMSLISQYETAHSVKDVRYYDGILYAAESEDGLGIYRVVGGTIEKIGSNNEPGRYNTCYTSIGLTAGGHYVVAQAANNYYVMIDVSDPADPRRIDSIAASNTSSMYYRNICIGLVDQKYLGIYDRDKIIWFYEDGNQLRLLTESENVSLDETRGMSAVGDKCVVISSNGYRILDPVSGSVSDNIVIGNQYFNGKCSSTDKMLAVSREYDGRVTLVDISDIESPKVLATFKIDGAVDIAVFSGAAIWIPCRNDGLMKLTPVK